VLWEQIGIFTSESRRYPAAATSYYARSLRFRGFEPGHTFISISFYYGLRVAPYIARQPRETNRDVELSRKDETRKDYLFTLDASSRNLAYLILNSGLLPEWNKTGRSYHIGRDSCI